MPSCARASPAPRQSFRRSRLTKIHVYRSLRRGGRRSALNGERDILAHFGDEAGGVERLWNESRSLAAADQVLVDRMLETLVEPCAAIDDHRNMVSGACALDAAQQI